MKRFGVFALLCGCLMLIGCSSAPVSFDRTPTPDVLVTTVAALQTQNAQLATQVAGLPATIESLPTATALPTQTPLPSPTPTETPAPTATPTPTRAATRRPAPTATPIQPQILSFTIDPGEVNPGESVTLRWNTTYASRVVIQQDNAKNDTYAALSVAPTGSIVLPISDQERLWHEFGLVAYNTVNDGTSNWIYVNIRCPYTYFFSQSADDYHWNCPEGPAVTSSAAEQYFESGRMIWLESEKRIYVLLNDGGLYTYTDTWTADQPDSDPGIKPPAGRYQPVRGFGKVWSADPYIRSRLGWAMAPEQGYQAQLQRVWSCCVSNVFYLREFDNRVVRLSPEKTPPGYWSFVVF